MTEPKQEPSPAVVSIDVRTLPYAERQLIVVGPDEVAAAVGAPANETWKKAGKVLIGVTLGLVPLAALEVVQAYRRAQDEGLDVRLITRSQAAELRFGLGHPRERVLYVGHPADPAAYIPMAEFHRRLFEHKVAEALRLLTSLGATDVEVEYVSGYDRSAELGVGVDDQKLTASSTTKKGRRVLSKMTLCPRHVPAIPKDLVWFDHEPLWREIARARLHCGLESFEIDIRYTDDFGVSVALMKGVKQAKLDVGGSFTHHEDTVWRLRGDFERLDGPSLSKP